MASETEQKEAYWLLGDGTLVEGTDPAKYDRLRAALTQSLLFERSLVISDSFAINNRNFRRCLRDPIVKELVAGGLIRVASRLCGTLRKPLIDTRNAFRDRNVRPPTFPQAEYDSDDDLEFLEGTCLFHTYELSNLEKRFTTGAKRVFVEDDALRLLGSDVASLICQLADEVTEDRGALTLAYFHYDQGIGAQLDERLGKGTWTKHHEAIRRIASAPYITGLQEEIDLNPVFAKEHEFAIDVWRKRAGVSEATGDSFGFYSEIDLSTYARGLVALQVDDLIKLRKSDEFGEFVDILKSNIPPSSEEIGRRFLPYRRRVELAICERLGVYRKPEAYPVKVENQVASGGTGGDWLLVNIMSFVAPLFGTFLSGIMFARQRGNDRAGKVLEDQRIQEEIALDEGRKIASKKQEEEGASALPYHVKVHDADVRDTLVGLSGKTG